VHDVTPQTGPSPEARLGGSTPLPILMYHALPERDADCNGPLDIPRHRFEQHLKLLHGEGYDVLGLTAAIEARRSDPTRRLVALTVDDGYVDVVAAADVVRGAGGSLTLYVPTGFVDDGRDAAGTFAHPLVSWDQVRELARAGVEIGSHACSHRPLDVLPVAEAQRELVESRARLSEHLGSPVRSMCYPYGYAGRRVERLTAEAGYANACIVGRAVAGGTDRLMALPRVQPLPGMTDTQFLSLIEHGEPGPAPALKRLAQPGWRVVRQVAAKVGVNLT
jgi:peptidoglycan/xylan/chitin deacetylase (PgdA/CDA1 family)